jgi:hypothetical protein
MLYLCGFWRFANAYESTEFERRDIYVIAVYDEGENFIGIVAYVWCRKQRCGYLRI